MPIKCTMLFQLATNVSDVNATERRLGGWSETYYHLSTDPATFQPRFQNLCSKRAALLPNGAAIVGQRYQQVVPTGASVTAANLYPGTASLQADIPQMALLCRAKAVDRPNIRPLILRGIPDARVVEGEYFPATNFDTALRAFFDALPLFAFKARDLLAPQWPIFTVTTGGEYFTEEDNALGANDIVRVLRTFTASGRLAGGRYRVGTWINARSGVFSGWDLGATKGGVIRRDTPIYPVFLLGGVAISRIITKKVGRPFKQYRGRQSRRR